MLLYLRPHLGNSSHQPVLDPRKRGLQPSSGKAAVRIHRGWIVTRRRAGCTDFFLVREPGRDRQSAAHQRCFHVGQHSCGRQHRQKRACGGETRLPAEKKKQGVGARRAIELLRDSKHLRLIAIVISFGAIGAAVIDQQLNMATEEFRKLLEQLMEMK